MEKLYNPTFNWAKSEQALHSALKSVKKCVIWRHNNTEGTCGVKKKFQKTLILAFEVIIVQPPKHIYI